MKTNIQRSADGRPFYRIVPTHDGLVDLYFSAGQAVPMFDDLTGRVDYNFRVLAVQGVNPDDPQYGGDLEDHIRRNYYAWVESAEVIEV
jgi:hypothetical protein